MSHAFSPSHPDTPTTLRLTAMSGGTGVVLPEAMLHRLHVGNGDILNLTPVPGGYMLYAVDASIADDMAIAEKVMQEDRDILKKLAE